MDIETQPQNTNELENIYKKAIDQTNQILTSCHANSEWNIAEILSSGRTCQITTSYKTENSTDVNNSQLTSSFNLY